MPRDDKGRYLTTGERIRNFTGWAFLIAVLLELVVLPFYHNFGNAGSEPTEKPVTIARVTIKPPPTPPPPTPTPPPTPQPQQTPQHHVVVNQHPVLLHPPKVSHAGGSGPAEHPYVAPSGACSGPSCTGVATHTASPGPVETAASCPDPNQEAHTVSEATAEYPESAVELGLGPVQVTVIVTVGPSGELVNASIASDPSHNSAIEHEALRVARTTTYAPHLVNCKPVTDQYRYLIDFEPG